MIQNIILKVSGKLKTIYLKLFIYMLPFILIVIPINFYLQTYKGNFFLKTLFILLDFLIIDFVFIIGLFKIKELIVSNDNNSNIFLEISVNIYNLLKIIVKKVILSYGLMYVFFIGLYFMIKWFLAYPIYIFENIDNPFPKSEKLVKNNSFKIFLLLLLMFIVPFIAFLLMFPFIKQFDYFGLNRRTVIIIIGGFLTIILFPIYILINYEAYTYLKENYIEIIDLPKLKKIQ